MKQKQNNNREVLARHEGLVIQEMPQETLVYDLESHSAHCLNETAAFVWSHCDGKTKADAIAKLMRKKFGKPVAEEVVWLALKQLRRANLLEYPSAAHAAKMDISRRAAVQRLGLAAALSLPLVTSIVTPTAAAAASVPVACQTCVDRGKGGFFQTIPCGTICADVKGTCYKNSGCGAGQELSCDFCPVCAGIADAKSWKAPGGWPNCS